MRKLLFLLILFLILFCRDSFAQSNKSEIVVTSAMARKIGKACQSNNNLKAFFLNLRGSADYKNSIIALSDLENHLDYANDFIEKLYEKYTAESSAITLRENVGFTNQEIDYAEMIGGLAKAKRDAIKEEEERKAEEEALSALAKDKVFEKNELSQEAIIVSNFDRSLYYLIFKDLKIKETSRWGTSFTLLITKEGSIEESDETSILPEPLYDYVKTYSHIQPAYSKPIGGIKYEVSSYLKVYFTTKEVSEHHNIHVKLIRNKETGKWESSKKSKTVDSIKNRVKDSEGLLSDLENKLNACPEFADKNKLNLKVTAYERTASSSIDQTENQYIYFFDIWTKKSPIGEEYIKIISL